MYCVFLRPQEGGSVVDQTCFPNYGEAEDHANMNRGFWSVQIRERRPDGTLDGLSRRRKRSRR